MEIIYSLKTFKPTDAPSIFLAGPTPRISKASSGNIPSWRKDAIELFKLFNFEGRLYIPEFENDVLDPEFTLSRQIDWEIKALEAAKIIMFWIPRDLNNLPAFTTNIEFGEWMKSGKIIIGAPPEAPKNEYIKERCTRLGLPWNNSLEECIRAVLKKSGGILGKTDIDVWLTSDTHFGHTRTNLLSKRGFASISEMDWTIIKNWNSVVKPGDIVYHLGDFGNPSMVKHLHGKKIFILPGNYDTPDILEELRQDKRVEILLTGYRIIDGSREYLLTHEPTKLETKDNEFNLFGHIHKLQMVKRNGLNVGVDCHNFTPIDWRTMEFYREAILKHYDENVFCGNNNQNKGANQ